LETEATQKNNNNNKTTKMVIKPLKAVPYGASKLETPKIELCHHRLFHTEPHTK